MPHYEKHVVPHGLYDEAIEAKEWHETRGMKVATPPRMPHVVASWIVAKCKSDRPAGCTCDGHRHEGGVGGCYYGGRLGLPRCECAWRD